MSPDPRPTRPSRLRPERGNFREVPCLSGHARPSPRRDRGSPSPRVDRAASPRAANAADPRLYHIAATLA